MARILIVDDEPDIRRLLSTVLRSAGHVDTLTAASATEALALLSAFEQAANIDLILMDLTLGDVDGLSATRQIKASEALRDIPVIVVTGRVEEEDLRRAFEAGATDYVRKPLNRTEFLARVRAALTLKEETDRRKARERELVLVTQQLEAANARLERLSSQDSLTGIPNRRHLNLTLEQEWARSLREQEPLSLLMVDIDCFKAYNDHLGHLAGDDCLRRVAAALDGALGRSTDAVARYGGEEFAAVLPNTSYDGALYVGEALRAAVEGLDLTHPLSAAGPCVTVSIGAATLVPNGTNTLNDLIITADRALYTAKDEGRNRVRGLAFTGERRQHE